MVGKKIKYNTGEILFFTSYILYITVLILNTSLYGEYTAISKIFGVIRYASYGILSIKILIDLVKGKFSKKEIVFITIIASFLLVGAIAARHKANLILWVYIVGAHDIDYKKIIKISLFTYAISILAVISGTLAGLLENKLYIEGNRNRYSVGFLYTTTISNFYFFITLMYLYIRRERLTCIETGVLVVISLLLFGITDTKYALILGNVAVFGVWFIKKNVFLKFSTLIKTVFICCVPAFAIIAIAMTIFFNSDSNIFVFFDKIVNGRFYFGHAAFLEHGVSLIGRPIRWSVVMFENAVRDPSYIQSSYYVDSSYMQIFLNYGIITIVLVCIFFISIQYKAVKRNDNYLGWMIFIIALHSMFDPQLIYIEYNAFLLAYSYILDKTNQLTRKGNKYYVYENRLSE